MFYIIENQIRPDGIVNTKTEARSNEKLAWSYFYERCGKMSANDQFDAVGIMLTDAYLNCIEHKIFINEQA